MKLICVTFFIFSATLYTVSANFCLKEINAARAGQGRKPVSSDNRLVKSAEYHNQFMAAKNCYEHRCPGEPSPGDRVKSKGYPNYSGEIIHVNQKNCKEAVKGWMNSPGHRKIMIDAGNKHVGCATRSCGKCNHKSYWTCNFGRG